MAARWDRLGGRTAGDVRRRGVRPSLAAAMAMAMAMAMLLPAAAAMADFAEMAPRLPAETDAVVAVDVERLLASPVGQQERWGGPSIDDWASRPVMVPPGATRVLVGIGMSAEDMLDPAWEVCLTEMENIPSLDTIVDAEGGYLDRLWNKEAVRSPVNAYFVPLEENLLASITPAHRKKAVNWVRQPVPKAPVITSKYIAAVVTGLSGSSEVVMAIDLEGAVSVPEVARRIEEADLPEMKDQDIVAISRALGSIVGVTLEVDVAKKITGKAVAEFSEDPAALRPVAEPLVMAILARNGMRLEDLDTWKYAIKGRTLEMTGDLSTDGLSKLLMLVQSPVPAATVPGATAAATAAAEEGGGKISSDPAKASQRYYKSVTKILSGFHQGTSASATAKWFRSAAQRIEKVPILGVDPALVEWGMAVGSKLKELAAVAGITQGDINARVAGVRSTNYGVYGTGGAGYYENRMSDAADAERRRHRQAMDQQSRAAALEQKTQAQRQVMSALEGLAGSREKIRAEMTAKYQVEF